MCSWKFLSFCRFLCDSWNKPLCLFLFGSESSFAFQVWLALFGWRQKCWQLWELSCDYAAILALVCIKSTSTNSLQDILVLVYLISCKLGSQVWIWIKLSMFFLFPFVFHSIHMYWEFFSVTSIVLFPFNINYYLATIYGFPDSKTCVDSQIDMDTL